MNRLFSHSSFGVCYTIAVVSVCMCVRVRLCMTVNCEAGNYMGSQLLRITGAGPQGQLGIFQGVTADANSSLVTGAMVIWLDSNIHGS